MYILVLFDFSTTLWYLFKYEAEVVIGNLFIILIAFILTFKVLTYDIYSYWIWYTKALSTMIFSYSLLPLWLVLVFDLQLLICPYLLSVFGIIIGPIQQSISFSLLISYELKGLISMFSLFYLPLYLDILTFNLQYLAWFILMVNFNVYGINYNYLNLVLYPWSQSLLIPFVVSDFLGIIDPFH